VRLCRRQSHPGGVSLAEFETSNRRPRTIVH
jgi:hypothetical protein